MQFDKYNLKYAVFDEFKDDRIVHAFTTRHGGVSQNHLNSLNLSYSRGDAESNVKENYRRLAEALNLDYKNFVGCRQVHGSDVNVITKADLAENNTDSHRKRQECDGLITNEPGIVLVTIHADCVPIFLFDEKTPAIGLVHSGWGGTLKEIVANALNQMKKHFGSQPQNIKMHIGPSICENCFEVMEDVKNKFATILPWSTEYIKRKDEEHWQIDLKGVIIRSAENQGVLKNNISVSEVCTQERNDLFFSHRGEKGRTGTMAALLSLKYGGKSVE